MPPRNCGAVVQDVTLLDEQKGLVLQTPFKVAVGLVVGLYWAHLEK
jgi:hypothetical protein